MNKATSYIESLRKKTQEHEADIEALKKQNVFLEQQSEIYGNVSRIEQLSRVLYQLNVYWVVSVCIAKHRQTNYCHVVKHVADRV